MHLEPTALDRKFQAGAIFRWRAFVAEQERGRLVSRCRSGHPELVRRRARALGGAGRLCQDRRRGGRRSVSKLSLHVFQCLVNGTAWPPVSCQFGAMCTEPATPHSCRQGAGRSSTKVGFGAGCLAGHQPNDRSRRDTGCCRLRGRLRVISPGCRAGVAGHVARLSMRAESMHALVKAMTNSRANYRSWGSEPATLLRVVANLQIGRSLKWKPPAGVRVIIWQKLSDDRPPTGQRSANR